MTAPILPSSPGPAPRFVAWVRDAAGNPAPLIRDSRTGKLSDGRKHVREIYDSRSAPGGAPQPRHLFMRDVAVASEIRRLMDSACPAASQILDAYESGALESYEAICDADERFVSELDAWRKGYLKGRKRDADSLFLQLETVLSLNKVIEVIYATPTIEDAFPVTVGGTDLDSLRTFVDEVSEELAQVGGDISVSAAPMSAINRGERFHRLVRIFAGAKVTDQEIRRFQEIQRANPNSGLNFDLWQRRLRGAALMVQRGVSTIEAFGKPANQIPGLFRSTGDFAIPSENLVFAGATATTNVDNVSTLVQNQQTAVGAQMDKMADSLALAPESFLKLSQQVYNSANASNVTSMEMIMRLNPQIASVYQVRECKPRSDEATALEAKGMDSTEAAINSGGLRVSGTQRNALVLYRKDPMLCEIVHGFSLRTTVYPPVVNETKALVEQTTGGLVVHEPRTMRIAYEN